MGLMKSEMSPIVATSNAPGVAAEREDVAMRSAANATDADTTRITAFQR
jgi:hypothetical protein